MRRTFNPWSAGIIEVEETEGRIGPFRGRKMVSKFKQFHGDFGVCVKSDRALIRKVEKRLKSEFLRLGRGLDLKQIRVEKLFVLQNSVLLILHCNTGVNAPLRW